MLSFTLFVVIFIINSYSFSFIVNENDAYIFNVNVSNITKLHMLQNYNKTLTFTLRNSQLNSIELYKLSLLSNVLIIDVSFNNMCCNFDFKVLHGCKKLRELNLKHNKFKFIKNSLADDVIVFQLIRQINLGYNDIEHISMAVFQSMPELRHVVLIRNKLARIDGFSNAQHFIPKIKVISITGNYISCKALMKMLLINTTTSLEFKWYEEYGEVDKCEFNDEQNMFRIDITKQNKLCCGDDMENSEDFYFEESFAGKTLISFIKPTTTTTKKTTTELKITKMELDETTNFEIVPILVPILESPEKSTKATINVKKLTIIIVVSSICIVLIYFIIPFMCKKYNKIKNVYPNLNN